MSDDLDPLRRLRPDNLLPDDPPDLDVLASGRRRLLTDITGSAPNAPVPTPSIYPRLAYRDEHAALEFLVRAFGFVERREARMEHPNGTLAWLELRSVPTAIVSLLGRRRRAEAVPEQVQVSEMPCGLLDHVYKEPAQCDRRPSEGDHRPDGIESAVAGECITAALTCIAIQAHEVGHRVVTAGREGPVRLVGQRCRQPRLRKRLAKELAHEPAILGPGQVLHDAADAEIRCGERLPGRAFVVQVIDPRHDRPPTEVEVLLQGHPLVRRLEIRIERR
jgi:hypothetical protein